MGNGRIPSPTCCWVSRRNISKTQTRYSTFTSTCISGLCRTIGRLVKKLTLNLGLRYEFATPPRERDFKWANFDSASGKFITAKSGSLEEEALIKPDRNNFAPRFGFAYSATPKTVIRGAYGLFYNHANRLGREGLLGFNPPFIILAERTDCGRRRAPSHGRALPACKTAYRRGSSISTASTWRLWRVRRKIRISARPTCSSTTLASSRNSLRILCLTFRTLAIGR